jgi:F0F1-type ATP synthase membrane subunit b/b'
VKRATVFLIAVTVLSAAALTASVKPAQDPKPAPRTAGAHASGAAGQSGGHQGDAVAPAPANSAPGTPGDAGHASSEAQPGHEAAGTAHGVPQEGHAAAAGHAAEGEHGTDSPWSLVARLFNFALLAGTLIYLLRSPFAAFLDNRKVQITKDLTDAAALRDSASRQLALVEERLKALPGELEALKQRGVEEIAAEEERIRVAAAVERERMLENARREIDRRVHLAERRLQRRAAELAVDLATDRVKRTITAADQARLVDRYLEQVRPETIGS